MDYEIIYNLKLKNKPLISGKIAKIKNCNNGSHSRIKIENILRKSYKENFDYIHIVEVQHDSKEFINFFNNICNGNIK